MNLLITGYYVAIAAGTIYIAIMSVYNYRLGRRNRQEMKRFTALTSHKQA